MNIIPTNKSDLEACDNLQNANDQEVIECLPELLTWLQDINWPVASRVIKRIIVLDNPLVEPIKDILQGDDGIWKYWIITNLNTKSNDNVFNQLKAELDRLAKQPSKNDTEEEVNLVAYEVLNNLW